MRKLKTDSIDMLFADLPYGQTANHWDVCLDIFAFWDEAHRVCKKDAAMIFSCSTMFGNTLINTNSTNFRYDLVWEKSRKVGFMLAKKRPLRRHEMVYVFYRRVPKAYTEAMARHHIGGDGTCPSSILQFRSEGKGSLIHATQKPVELMEWIITYFSREGETVLDPCMGSGTTGVACKNLKREFIGMEKDKEIFEKATSRLQ